MSAASDHPELLSIARDLCAENGARLVYLTIFGSTLYGTEIPGKSDLDVRGLFLPSPESLVLGTARHSLHLSSADSTRRNGEGDRDVDLFSVQRWLLELLPAGEIGALDLLFSPSSAGCVLFSAPCLAPVFAEPLRFFNSRQGEACAAYSLGQAKKYGIRGSRLGALRAVVDRAVEICPERQETRRLAEILPDLAKACSDSRFCELVTQRDGLALRVCGKMHPASLSVTEFLQRARRDLARYEEADAGWENSIDWKALSHAIRAIRQEEELLRTGTLRFPLACREELVTVKLGQVGWKDVEPRIVDGLKALESLRMASPFAGPADSRAARRVLLQCYGLGSENTAGTFSRQR